MKEESQAQQNDNALLAKKLDEQIKTNEYLNQETLQQTVKSQETAEQIRKLTKEKEMLTGKVYSILMYKSLLIVIALD